MYVLGKIIYLALRLVLVLSVVVVLVVTTTASSLVGRQTVDDPFCFQCLFAACLTVYNAMMMMMMMMMMCVLVYE